MPRAVVALFAAAMLFASALPAQAAERIALVIGNSAYETAPELANSRADAEAVAVTVVLADLGFEVISGVDLDRDGMEDAVDRFGAAAGVAELALVFYAGHSTSPREDLYFALCPILSNLGVVDLDALVAGRPQATARNPAETFRIFRVGDAVACRNIHAVIHDSLRLCKEF